MKENKSVLRHGAVLATIDHHENWVRCRARELDIETEMDIAWALWGIMNHFRRSFDFAGVSSNNIFWETTKTPIRMIGVPAQTGFAALINPRYEKLSGRSVKSTERCGSIPNLSFIVNRRTHVVISGYDINGQQIELEYGSKRGNGDHCPSWIVQHEMDHLDGVLLMDKSIV